MNSYRLERQRVEIYKDKQLHAVVCLSAGIGSAFWLLLPCHLSINFPITSITLVNMLLVYPVLEELAFRGGIQEELSQRKALNIQYYGVSTANIMTSCLFALFHLIQQPLLFAALTFIPSLLFGHFKERYASLLVPIGLHSLFNAIFLVSLVIKNC